MKNNITKKDFHLHSNYSDGLSSIEEMTEVATKNKFTEIAFTDHVRRSTNWLKKYVRTIDIVRKKYPNIKVLSGIEAKAISLNGDIDANTEFFDIIDIVLGSIHRIPKGEDEYLLSTEILSNKKRALNLWYESMLKLIENKYVSVIAHPTLILKRFDISLPTEYKIKIAKNAEKYRKIFEVNLKYNVPDNEFLEILNKNNVELINGSDSHSVDDFIKINNLKNDREL